MNHNSLLWLSVLFFAIGVIGLATVLVWCCLLASDRKRRQLETVAAQVEQEARSRNAECSDLRRCTHTRILS